MKSSIFSLDHFNRTLQESVNRQNLNFCKAIAISQRKISITLKYAPDTYNKEYVVLDRNLSPQPSSDFSAFYFGCSPKLDSRIIIDAISSLSFRSHSSIEAFLSDHCDLFMLHPNQSRYLLDVAKLIVLTMASKYGISLKMNDKTDVLIKSLSEFPDIVSVYPEEGKIDIHGCPTDELIALFKSYRFMNSNGFWEIRDSGCTFESIYTNTEHIKLLVGKVFYSGVMIKPLLILELTNQYESDNIRNIVIHYERSTFATVCAFDDNRILHPLLSNSREALIQMFTEDELHKELLFKSLSSDYENDYDRFKNISTYLKNSFNVNQIGISSNIKTADGKILFCVRGTGTIDSGSLYPSVNGNAEVYDQNVSFYNHSVYEDLPSISVQDIRSDLLGEISREAYGELRLIAKKESWECYGIIVSGTAPHPSTYSHAPRRCHINILFENEVAETVEQIVELKSKASESFESKEFMTIDVHYYRGHLHRLFANSLKCINNILSSKDFIESMLLLIITMTSINSISLTPGSISEILSIVFAGLIFITNIVQLSKLLLKILRNIKRQRHIHVYRNMSYAALCKAINKAMVNNYHPVAYAALKMHVENMFYNHQENDDLWR